ncbi:hypothetical protein SAMN05661008_00885 [Alkalithermobacter thermoalcaliphilus JW-YL-7 = DSM 7308]|uniref:Uncharacterized protein n=1 Tax=Alkalithermobacter thermoalcaliphilus JW-YL-7 = DSM 7308 TaxID=1121328 RepID=A0A150FQK7_CLOPD|nr:hypothetical protein JWYL7_0968 [[Clostridium] paradoxum JW-YL-7 = DSM 7308]SHK78395.1 hypothetical protein SAMN05661008_00885 [[Clostridium] paradoxum JW-YL-7 = DSM 7308]
MAKKGKTPTSSRATNPRIPFQKAHLEAGKEFSVNFNDLDSKLKHNRKNSHYNARDFDDK